MASTYTSNLAVEKPGSGDYVGTWDTPVNSDFDVFDQAIGTTVTIGTSAGSLTISQSQARCASLIFNGTLAANVVVTIPGLSSAPGTTVSGKGYTVQNQCANSSAYLVTIASTVTGSQYISLPPYEVVDILVEGTGSTNAGSVKFRNLGRVGTFWDYAGSSVPIWVSPGCLIPPYLNCDGTTFSSGTYPALALVLGGTTLPDSRGRFRATLNQGQSRITSGSSTGGVDGNTNLSGGGSQTTTLSSQNVPPAPVTDPGHTHTILSASGAGNLVGGGAFPGNLALYAQTSSLAYTSITVGSTSPTNFSNIPPAYIGGITMIRSA